METYVKSILCFTLVSAVLQQMLPNTHYRKVVGIVCGLLLILLFLQPLLSGAGIQEQILTQFSALAEKEDGVDSSETLTKAVTEQYQRQIALFAQTVTGRECEVKVTRRRTGGVGSESLTRVVVYDAAASPEMASALQQQICDAYCLTPDQVSIR